MKNMYEISGDIIDLSKITNINEVDCIDYTVLDVKKYHEFTIHVGGKDKSFYFNEEKEAILVRDKLIEAINELPKIAESKTWIVSEWKYLHELGNHKSKYDQTPILKYASELYCIETGERREI